MIASKSTDARFLLPGFVKAERTDMSAFDGPKVPALGRRTKMVATRPVRDLIAEAVRLRAWSLDERRRAERLRDVADLTLRDTREIMARASLIWNESLQWLPPARKRREQALGRRADPN